MDQANSRQLGARILVQMELMGVDGLTRENIASRLQRVRRDNAADAAAAVAAANNALAVVGPVKHYVTLVHHLVSKLNCQSSHRCLCP